MKPEKKRNGENRLGGTGVRECRKLEAWLWLFEVMLLLRNRKERERAGEGKVIYLLFIDK